MNKKAKLIVLIMIGVCAILLVVCIFALTKVSKEDTTNDEDITNDKVENIIEENDEEEVETESNDDSYIEIDISGDRYQVYGQYKYTNKNIGDLVDYNVNSKFNTGEFSDQYYYDDGEKIFSRTIFNIYGAKEIRLEDLNKCKNVSTEEKNGFKWTVIKNFNDEEAENFEGEMDIIQYAEYKDGLYIVLYYEIQRDVEHKNFALLFFNEISNSVVKKGEKRTIDNIEKDPELSNFERTYAGEESLSRSSIYISGNNNVSVGYSGALHGDNVKRFYSFNLSEKFEYGITNDYKYENENGDDLSINVYIASNIKDTIEGDRLNRSNAEINGKTWDLIYIPENQNSPFKEISGCGYTKLGDYYFVVEYKYDLDAQNDAEMMTMLNNIFNSVEYIYESN